MKCLKIESLKTNLSADFEVSYSTWDLLQNQSRQTIFSACQHTVIEQTFYFPNIMQKNSKPIKVKAYLLQWQTVVKHIWVPRAEMDWGE